MSARVWPNGHRISSEKAWKSIEALICCTPPITRLSTKSRTAWVSGAEKADGPR